MSLPTGYTEVQYIQSSGTQWIDSGFKPNQNTRIKMDCNVIGFNSMDMFLFGARIASGNTTFCLAADDVNTKWFALYGNAVLNPTGTCTGKHSIDFNQNVLTLDGEKFTFEKTTFQSSYDLLLFATITNGSADSQRGKMAVYSCQLYDNGSLIRKFIPCINPDGEVGLYDMVNSKFYGNAGTGIFFAGPPRVRLPSGYKQLEYIQSSGTQYVDTGFKPNQDTRCLCDFQYTKNATAAVFMSRPTSNDSAMFGVFNIGGKLRSDYNTEKKSFSASLSPLGRLTYDKNKNICQIGDETVVNTAGTFSAIYNLYLFCSNDGDTAAYFSSGYLYSSKLYDNATLIRNYIPCSNPSGAIGLYDLVNSKFYANAGTGVFTAGPEVTWPSNDAIYVKVNGIWKQIDGIKLL